MIVTVVSKAFQVLSDGDKRAVYDRSGDDPDSRGGGMSSARSSAGSAFSNGSFAREGEISPEDLFNMFFGGNMGGMNGNGFGGPGTSSCIILRYIQSY